MEKAQPAPAPAEDVYEFKSVKDPTPPAGAGSPQDSSSKPPDPPEATGDSQDPADKEKTDQDPSAKRTYQDVSDPAEEGDDESRRKKRKDGDAKEKSGGTPVRNVGQTGKTTNKPGPSTTKSNTLTTTKASSDRKSPVPSPKPPVIAATDAEADDAKPEGLKVPPLKIVIPQSSGTDGQETGSNRNGKSGTQRQHPLPYVVASSSGEAGEKDGSSGTGSPGTDTGQTGKDDKKEFSGTNSGDDQVIFFLLCLFFHIFLSFISYVFSTCPIVLAFAFFSFVFNTFSIV